MSKLYVIDTNSLIYYFDSVFCDGSNLSAKAHKLIAKAFESSDSEIKLSIPSVVFVEIFEKWLKSEEFARKFHYEVFELIDQSPNIEIKPIEQEVLENLECISGSLSNHDVHDKIILASAMMLNCPLITTDQAIIAYVAENKVIPAIVN